MNDALSVRGLESVRNLDREGEKLIDLEGILPDHRGERLPFQELHNNEVPAFVLLDGINGADVGMVKGGSGSRLTLKSLERMRILCEIIGKKL